MQKDEFIIELEKETIPKRIQLLPAGKIITGRDGRKWTVKNAEQLVKASNDYMPHHSIDENHSVDLSAKDGKSTPAFGWFQNITIEANGEIWADVEWTEKGKIALEKKEYRFISPVFLNNENAEITTIARAALTNKPNLSLKTLNSEENEEKNDADLEEVWQKITQVLELSQSTSLEDVLQAIMELKQNVNQKKSEETAVNAEQVTLNAEQIAFNTEKIAFEKEKLKQKAELMIETASKEGKITPANKEKYLNLCMASGEIFEKVEQIIKDSPSVIKEYSFSKELLEKNTPVLNANEEEIMNSLGYNADQWQKIKDFAKIKNIAN